ncbi:uncharacterized protein [Chelonus insularis]|nr:uncharacterized protein LOC118070484 isoform X2 [Chelonus insularis]XP_034944981.1 uncharacterized protein LOC118070484 isoform X2 [Chelonus insularis]
MSFKIASPEKNIEYRLLTEDKLESALEVQQKSMYYENVAKGVGIYEEEGAAEVMKVIFREVVKDNCTIVAIDTNTDQVVGVSFNKLHVPIATDVSNIFNEVVNNHVKQRSALALIQFLDDIESKVNLFERYNTQAAMEIFYVGTDPDYCGRRIGHGIVSASLELARGLQRYQNNPDQIVPGVAFGVFTSNYSQKIAESFHFEWLETVWYSDCEYWGKTMAERIGDEHKTAKLGALHL